MLALREDRDFIIETFGHPYEGKPVNLSQLIEDPAIRTTRVTVRYALMRKMMQFVPTDHHVREGA